MTDEERTFLVLARLTDGDGARLTVEANIPANEYRIYLRGNKGDHKTAFLKCELYRGSPEQWVSNGKYQYRKLAEKFPNADIAHSFSE